MKKKLLALGLAITMVAVAVFSGTLAYLSDSEGTVNVATLGNVDIEQIELQRAENIAHAGTAKDGDLVPYEQGQNLYPAYPKNNAATDYSAEPTDLFYWGPYVTAEGAGNGLWNDEKLVGTMDKFVFVKNTGKSDAYYRTWIALECPVGMEFSESADKELMMNVNVNYRFDWEEVGHKVIGGVRYLIMCATYTEALAPDEISRPSLLQVVLTHNATNEDMDLLGDTYEILVFSQACQTENFPDAKTALKAAFGAGHPWTDAEIVLPELVATADELVYALSNGGNVALTEDVVLDDVSVKITTDTVINLNGHTLKGQSTSSTTSNLIKVEAGKTLTLKNGTVSFTATTPDTDWGDNGPKPYPGYANNTISCSGTLIIDGATVENKTAKGGASYAVDCYPGANLIVNDGEIKGYDKIAIRMFANSKTVPTNVTINGGTVSGYRAVWVQLPSSNPADAPIANLTVNGGTLISTDATYTQVIYSYSYGNSFAATKIALNGGTFYGDVALGGGYKGDTETVTINERNCTFYGDVFRYTDAEEFYYVETGKTTVGVDSGANLNEVVKNGGNAVFTEDITAPLANSAIYGTPVAAVQKGGVIDGNGNELFIENPQYNGYAIETYGGTIKNLSITTAVGRGIVISSPTADVYVDNVVVDGPGYAINTTEHNGKKLFVTNSTVNGWTSLAGLDLASFANCKFGENQSKYWQNNGYDQDYDRLIRPYVNATFTACEFEQGYYIDLSALEAGCTVTLTDCVCNGVEITAENYNGYITFELPAGRTLADCVVFA